jgi:hypothetical protein
MGVSVNSGQRRVRRGRWCDDDGRMGGGRRGRWPHTRGRAKAEGTRIDRQHWIQHRSEAHNARTTLSTETSTLPLPPAPTTDHVTLKRRVTYGNSASIPEPLTVPSSLSEGNSSERTAHTVTASSASLSSQKGEAHNGTRHHKHYDTSSHSLHITITRPATYFGKSVLTPLKRRTLVLSNHLSKIFPSVGRDMCTCFRCSAAVGV